MDREVNWIVYTQYYLEMKNVKMDLFHFECSTVRHLMKITLQKVASQNRSSLP